MVKEKNDAELKLFVGRHLKRHCEHKHLTQGKLTVLLGIRVEMI